MFISQVNRNFTFSNKQWLVSIATPLDDHHTKAPSAYVFIEGVLNHSLMYGRYEIKATPWQTENPTMANSVAYLSSIRYFEADQYKEIVDVAGSIGYPAMPKQCNELSKALKKLALSIHEDTLVDNAPSNPTLIQRSCINWCFDLLSKHCILP